MSDFVSIIIPVRNEREHIAECLESIFGQNYPRNLFEVLLVDGMSTDGTREIITQYRDKYHGLHLLDNPLKIVPSALNIGIGQAYGDIIIRMDAHTYYDDNYIYQCVETLKNVNADNVGGPIVTLPGDNTHVARAIAMATSHPFGVGNSKFRTARKAQYVDTVTFGAFRKEVFNKVGLYNERLHRNQDIELNSRIIAAGGKIYLNPEIRSYYYNQATLKGLWKQNFSNGKWNVFTLAMNKKSLSLRHFIPLIFVLVLMISAALSFYSFMFFCIFLLTFVTHTFVNLYISLIISISKGYKMIFLLPIVFLTLHFSYGLGYLSGLAKLRKFKKQKE